MNSKFLITAVVDEDVYSELLTYPDRRVNITAVEEIDDIDDIVYTKYCKESEELA